MALSRTDGSCLFLATFIRPASSHRAPIWESLLKCLGPRHLVVMASRETALANGAYEVRRPPNLPLR